MLKQVLIVVALVLALRLPFLHQAVQGDDLYYLYGAQHAQIDPLHPNHVHYVFRGDLVDMRGQSHPPLNSWILGGLLDIFGDVKEVQFHLAYILFSLIAALAMLSLARRFANRPLLATVLFCAVPAFVVNGNSFEADLPFLAFWMAAMALFVYAVDRDSEVALIGSVLAAGLAALAAYQGIFITPILALYVFQQRRTWIPGWIGALAAPAILVAWQIWERITGGAIPAAVLAGYMRSYHFAAFAQSLRGATALVVHLGWMISPLIVLSFIPRATWKRWVAVSIAIFCAASAAFHDFNPLFGISIVLGLWILMWCVSAVRSQDLAQSKALAQIAAGSQSQAPPQSFLAWWVLLFFAPAMLVFFAGSARYLLPIAAPLAILAANAASRNIALAGAALQLALALPLAVVNYQHWNTYRHYVELLQERAQGRRIWVNADWGLRYYLEAAGALPLMNHPASSGSSPSSMVQPGDIVVTSDLSNPLPPGVPLTPFYSIEIRPRLPLRLISLDGRSAYSFGSHGLLPFELSNSVIDRVHADIAIAPKLSYLDPHDPQAAGQFISGIFADGWTARQATVLLKVPEKPAILSASLYVPASAAARHVSLSANGRVLVQGDLKADSIFNISVPAPAASASLVVTLTIDKTFSVPGDMRDLGVVLTGIGFK